MVELNKDCNSCNQNVHQKNNTSSSNTAFRLASFVLVIILIALPTLLLTYKQELYNPCVQVLFDILLFGASIWFAVTIDNKKAERSATGKWLPKAESCCKELLAIISNIYDRQKRKKTCQYIKEVFPNISEEQYAPLITFIEMRCQECDLNFRNIRNHLENSVSGWKTFIEENCEKSECARITKRLYQTQETFEK